MQRNVLRNSAILLLGVTLLAGCGDLRSLPEKERYQRINDVLDRLDYESAGEIVSVKKDRGDGVFSPSSIRVEYDDAESFQSLKDSSINLLGLNCRPSSERQISCKVGEVDLSIKRASNGDETVVLLVTDRYNGRESD